MDAFLSISLELREVCLFPGEQRTPIRSHLEPAVDLPPLLSDRRVVLALPPLAALAQVRGHRDGRHVLLRRLVRDDLLQVVKASQLTFHSAFNE